MIEIIKQVLKYYIENNKSPITEDIIIDVKVDLSENSPLFITLYKGGNIVGSSGSIKELETDLIAELISNTISAYKDSRFPDLGISDIENLKIRLDFISNREPINYEDIKEMNPMNNGIIVIKKDYEKLGVILPNISNNITNGNELLKIIEKKVEESINNDFIVYKISTKIERNF